MSESVNRPKTWEELSESERQEYTDKMPQTISYFDILNNRPISKLTGDQFSRGLSAIFRKDREKYKIFTQYKALESREALARLKYYEDNNRNIILISGLLKELRLINNLEFEIITNTALESDNQIKYISDKIVELSNELYRMPFGLDWRRKGSPNTSDLDGLSQWCSEPNFSVFIEKLQLLDMLKQERSILQNKEEQEIINRTIAEEQSKRDSFILDDRLLALMPDYIKEEQKERLIELCEYGRVNTKIKWYGSNVALLIKYIEPLFMEGLFHTNEKNYIKFLLTNFCKRNGTNYSLKTLQNARTPSLYE